MPSPRIGSSRADDPPAPLVRAELDRILASELFTRSERLSSFLRFVVDRTLAGEGESPKEHVIAVELYGKGADFTTAADPIVRVDARRLRQAARVLRRRDRRGSDHQRAERQLRTGISRCPRRQGRVCPSAIARRGATVVCRCGARRHRHGSVGRALAASRSRRRADTSAPECCCQPRLLVA
jgi:hypothetical protein